MQGTRASNDQTLCLPGSVRDTPTVDSGHGMPTTARGNDVTRDLVTEAIHNPATSAESANTDPVQNPVESETSRAERCSRENSLMIASPLLLLLALF